MTAPHVAAAGAGSTALDDALAAAANRWRGHCLLEVDTGRVAAHHVQGDCVPAAVISAVLNKSVHALAGCRTGLRTLGLIAGGAVVSATLPTGESVVTAPLGTSSTGCLWLVTQERTRFDVNELAHVSARVLLAHMDGLDPLALDGTALADCLRRGEPLSPRLVAPGSHFRLLGLHASDADPVALASAVRRSGVPHVCAARFGDALVVVFADNTRTAASARDLLTSIEGRGLLVRGALGFPVPADASTQRARDQVLACLPQAPEGEVVRVADYRSQLVLEQLRAPLARASALVDDPLAALDQAASRDVDFHGSLLAWLDAHGDIAAAARQMDVHVNTLRYRVRRAFELLGTDLCDPTERLEIHLRLRLLR